MIDDLTLFIRIVEQGSLAAAAQSMGLPPATVTRRLQKFENQLGCKLINRSARKFNLTSEGESYFQTFSGLVKEFDEKMRNLGSELHELTGSLKVLAPTNISIGILQPMWSGFIRRYPDIQLELHINNEVQDMPSSQIDLALRIGPQSDSSLYQKKLGSVATILVASSDYIAEHGLLEVPSDLTKHRLLRTNTLPVWTLFNQEENIVENIYPHAATVLNDIRLANQLACDGLGIALLPVSEIYEEISSGKLQHILKPWAGPKRDIYAIWPSGRLLSAKAKALKTFMADYISHTSVLQGYVF